MLDPSPAMGPSLRVNDVQETMISRLVERVDREHKVATMRTQGFTYARGAEERNIMHALKRIHPRVKETTTMAL
eukprot:4948059-Heterocapsa_arctica.AAC.1